MLYIAGPPTGPKRPVLSTHHSPASMLVWHRSSNCRTEARDSGRPFTITSVRVPKILYCAAAGSIAKHKTAEAAKQARLKDIITVSIHRAEVACLHRYRCAAILARSGDFAVTPITRCLFGAPPGICRRPDHPGRWRDDERLSALIGFLPVTRTTTAQGNREPRRQCRRR
jgi:hypothetical protein